MRKAARCGSGGLGSARRARKWLGISISAMLALAALSILLDRTEMPWGGRVAADLPPASSELGSAPASSGFQGVTARPPTPSREAILPRDGKGTRTIHTFLNGKPVPTVLFTADTPRQPGFPFSARPKATWHVVPEALVAKEDNSIALGCEGAYVRAIRAQNLLVGDNRIDMIPARQLRVQLVNAPSGIRDAVDLEAQITFDTYETPVARLASVSMSVGVMPVSFANSDTCDVPVLVDSGGEVTVCARPRGGGPEYTVKRAFGLGDDVVIVDISSLGFCKDLGDLDLRLDFPFAKPSGRLRVALIDSNGSSLKTVDLDRTAEAMLIAKFRGIQPGIFRPELEHVDGLKIRVAPLEVRSGWQECVREIIAESEVEVLVTSGDEEALDAAHIVVFDETGWVLGDPARKGTRIGQFHARALPSGTYFFQARSGGRPWASHVSRVLLRVGEKQQLALALEPAGRVQVQQPGDISSLDLVSGSGLTSRFFLRSKRPPFWCPIGPYTAVVNGRQCSIEVRRDEVTSLDLGQARK